MIKPELLENPKLKRYIRDFSVGEFLFEEGYLGDAVFLIVEGTVCIYKKSATGLRLIHTALGGDVVGEKGVIGEPGYKRETSAQAKTSVLALEVDRRSLAIVQTLVPDLFIRMLRMIEMRMDQTIELLEILYSKNDIDRITQYIVHYFKYNKKLGKNLQITVDDVTSAANTDAAITQKALEDLVKKKILRAVLPGYALIDAVALSQYAPELRERLAA